MIVKVCFFLESRIIILTPAAVLMYIAYEVFNVHSWCDHLKKLRRK